MIKVSDLKKLVTFFEENKIENVVIIPDGLDMVSQFGNMKMNWKFYSPEMAEHDLLYVKLSLTPKAPHDALIEKIKTERL